MGGLHVAIKSRIVRVIDGVAFKTRARTVDHLGREQIADTPTAISELWKNAYDAYARSVSLDIYDGEVPVAVMSDDGHGMNKAEFVDRWLVVGTESKATEDRTPREDRNGLPMRPRQGQKGIGRLSCANLGPVLLLLSKRINQPYVAALVDWRLFENPFLILSDVELPVIEGENVRELLKQIPDLTKKLAENISGGIDENRKKRLQAAWSAYDETRRRQHQEDTEGQSKAVHEDESGNETEGSFVAPSEAILSAISAISFNERHLSNWPVFDGKSGHGTALLVSAINFDLSVELRSEVDDAAAKATRDRFFETLTSFIDPFEVHPPGSRADEDQATTTPDFTYAVRAWTGPQFRNVVGGDKRFDRSVVAPMEHQIEGVVDTNGRFVGRVKAFGDWIEGPCIIDPPKDLVIPRRSDSQVGPFKLYIASMEFRQENTTHSPQEFTRYVELAEKYSGFMIFRDALRVLPYGRTDNDFFEIEMRRSKSVGREFWNHRQMFGRIAIDRNHNPNLKDKAGREGLLDNRAAKTLRELVANLLMVSARRYFGSASDIRVQKLPGIRESNQSKRAADARNALRKRQRSEFGTKLRSASQAVPKLVVEMKTFSDSMRIDDIDDVAAVQQTLEQFRETVADLKVPGAPKSLGALEDTYIGYRERMREISSLMTGMSEKLVERIEAINPSKPRELLDKQVSRNAALISRRIANWRSAVDELQKTEFQRLKTLVSERNKLFVAEAAPIIERFEQDEISYLDCSKFIDSLKTRIDDENEDIFVPYIAALRSLKESIDLEHLATFGMEELSDLRVELERLNALAQLGIAVEIVGHDLQDFDEIIAAGLRSLPEGVRDGKAAREIRLGYEGLTDQLRFLSPLRLAGQKIQRWVRGQEIADYVEEFFRPALAKASVQFEATPSFRSMRVFEQPSRLFPVFINLVNNSIYWLSTSKVSHRRVILDVADGEVVISDNGPGVEADDVASLFGLFFTRKSRGGRGVGLYLARANLAAGGHRIRYETSSDRWPLTGANFVITFRGAEYSGE